MHAHRVAQEEIFGPVLSVMIPPSRDTPEEAVERANNTPYGLSAGVWTDKKSFRHLTPALSPFEAEREKILKLRAGGVQANTYNKFDLTSLPRLRDGYKESGFGREGGIQGLAAYYWLD